MSDITRIDWRCETCSDAIPDGAGVIGVPFTELANWRTAEDPATWRPQHNACITPDCDVYSIPVGDVRDASGLLRWSAHLSEKPWLHATNWGDILRQAGGER